MEFNTARRDALIGIGTGLVISGLAQTGAANAATEPSLEASGATSLHDLSRTLAGMPRRRDFRDVPMILTEPADWDAAPLAAVLAYKGGPKQAWDNTDLTGPWLNGMRNTLNSQVWSFKEPNFLCVSATHGAAHLALFDQATWDKYGLAKLAGGNVTRNTYIVPPPAASHDAADFEIGRRPLLRECQQRGRFAATRRSVHGLPQCHLGGRREIDCGEPEP